MRGFLHKPGQTSLLYKNHHLLHLTHSTVCWSGQQFNSFRQMYEVNFISSNDNNKYVKVTSIDIFWFSQLFTKCMVFSLSSICITLVRGSFYAHVACDDTKIPTNSRVLFKSIRPVNWILNSGPLTSEPRL